MTIAGTGPAPWYERDTYCGDCDNNGRVPVHAIMTPDGPRELSDKEEVWIPCPQGCRQCDECGAFTDDRYCAMCRALLKEAQ